MGGGVGGQVEDVVSATGLRREWPCRSGLHRTIAALPPPIRSRRGPRRRRPAKLHADKGYDNDNLRRWLRSRNITPRTARRGIESSQWLGQHRWTVERTVAWLAGCRRLHRRYDLATRSHGTKKSRVNPVELSA